MAIQIEVMGKQMRLPEVREARLSRELEERIGDHVAIAGESEVMRNFHLKRGLGEEVPPTRRLQEHLRFFDAERGTLRKEYASLETELRRAAERRGLTESKVVESEAGRSYTLLTGGARARLHERLVPAYREFLARNTLHDSPEAYGTFMAGVNLAYKRATERYIRERVAPNRGLLSFFREIGEPEEAIRSQITAQSPTPFFGAGVSRHERQRDHPLLQVIDAGRQVALNEEGRTALGRGWNEVASQMQARGWWPESVEAKRRLGFRTLLRNAMAKVRRDK